VGCREQDREAREREREEGGPRHGPDPVLGHGAILPHAAAGTPAGNVGPPEGVEVAVVGRPPDNEAALVARAQGGDAVAYGSLVRAHQDIAFRVACLAGGSAADAEEAAQEGFVKAWRALPRFRTGAPFRPWLLAIVANEARNRRRAAGRRAGLVLRAGEQAERAPGTAASSPETLVLASERREALLAALGALDERDRSVLTCRYLLELSEEETAAALGCRRGTVKSRTSRALERLRAHAGLEEVGTP
jgi:RNA polymerase sigma-70 factor, ECF subfamily